MTKRIALDCAPGMPRPDTYIEDVMQNSGVEYDGRETVSRFFGEWIWDFSDIPDEQWTSAQPHFEEKITKLYNNGNIRYGSW